MNDKSEAKISRSIAVFCMPENGHFQRMRSLISNLAGQGFDVHVFTHQKFFQQVVKSGGIFFDLFSKYPMEAADNESIPVPSRFVSYAATYVEPVCREVELIGASLVVHDGFAVIGKLTAILLGIPRVNVCAGHNVDPARFISKLKNDPRVRISPRCFDAVEVLREKYGMADASPFSYVSSHSPDLNIYCEPPEFLDEGERQALEPVAFYGSLPSASLEQGRPGSGAMHFGIGSEDCLKVYVSFGTVIWRYYAADALRALNTLSAAFADMDHVRAVISLGGTNIGSEARDGIRAENVLVEDYVDQKSVLREADLFFTHHGLNSTHEAIAQGVPMVSYPFFWDQPGLAQKCQSLGLALPLSSRLRGTFSKDDVFTLLDTLTARREPFRAALSRARAWEELVTAGRPAVIQRMVDLIK